MAATLAEIREGIAANLAAVFSPDVTTSAYQLEQFMPPVLYVSGPDHVTYDQAAARGLDEWIINLEGFGGPMLQGAQVVLDGWISPSGTGSVKAAIEADRTLGGKVMDTHVMAVSSYRFTKFADGTALLGAEWQIRVLNQGD